MTFQEITELPTWIKTLVTLLVGAGGAKMLGIWLENRRLEKKEYRDTLLGRIKELEAVIAGMQESFTKLNVNLALALEENNELREKLGIPRLNDVHKSIPGQPGDSDAKPAQPV